MSRRRSRKKKEEIVEDEVEEEEEDDDVDMPSSIPTPKSVISSIFTLTTSSQDDNMEEEIDYDAMKSTKLRSNKPKDLKKNLEAMSKSLRQIDQLEDNDDKPYDDKLPKALMQNKLFNSQSEAVPILTAKCIVDILRITAPEPPYQSKELRRIFHLFITQISKLEEGTTRKLHSDRFYLLERLGQFNMYALLTEEASEHCEEVCSDTVAIFYRVLRKQPDMPPHYIEHMKSIMVSIFECLGTFEEETIMYCLKPLSSKKHSDELVRDLVKRTLKETVDVVTDGVGNCLMKKLSQYEADSSSKKKKTKKKADKKKQNLFTTIFELNNISSKLLLHIMPQLSKQLFQEEKKARSEAIHLLGMMFCKEGSTLASEYRTIYESFLERFNDKDSFIRKYMCKFAYEMIMNHYDVSVHLPSKLKERIRDNDEVVRIQAIKSLSSLSIRKSEIIDHETMHEIGDRCRDKKPKVRLLAMERLSHVYRKMKEKNKGSEQDWDNIKSLKFDWIPSKIFDYYIDQTCLNSHKSRIEEIVIDNLLPSNPKFRAQRLVEIFKNMSQNTRNGLIKLMEMKRTFRQNTISFLGLKINNLMIDEEEEDSDSDSDSDDQLTLSATQKKKKERKFLCKTLLDSEEKSEIFWKAMMRGDSIYKPYIDLIKKSCNEKANFKDYVSYRKSLSSLRKKTKKSDLKKINKHLDIIETIIRRISMNFVTMEHISILMKHSFELFRKEDFELSYYNTLFLKTVAPVMPNRVFKDSFKDILSFLSESSKPEYDDAPYIVDIQNDTLEIISLTGRELEMTNNPIARKLNPILKKFCWTGKNGEAKFAAQAILKVFLTPRRHFHSMISKMMKKIEEYIPGNKNIEEDLLPILDTFCVVMEDKEVGKELFTDYSDQLSKFIFEKAMVYDPKDSYVVQRKFISVSQRSSTDDDNDSDDDDEEKTIIGDDDDDDNNTTARTSFHNPSTSTLVKKKSINLLVSLLSIFRNQEVGKTAFNLFFKLIKNKGLQKNKKNKLKDEDEDEGETDDEKEEEKEEEEGKILSISDGNAHILLSCLKAVLKLSSIFKRKDLLTVDRYLSLSYLCVLPHPSFRRSFMDTVFEFSKNLTVDSKFAAILFLCVGDDHPHNAYYARQLVKKMISSCRYNIDRFQKVTALINDRRRKNNQQQKPILTLSDRNAISIYPEYMLPRLILLLAHYPSFMDHYPLFLKFQKIMFAFFDEVCGDGRDNQSFFHEMIQKIKVRKDVLVEKYPNSKNHSQIICDLAMEVCNKCIQTIYQLKFPGKISIPSYFQRREQLMEDEDEEEEEEEEEDDDDNNNDIDPLNNTPKRKKKRKRRRRNNRDSSSSHLTHFFLPGKFRIQEKKSRHFIDPKRKEIEAILKLKRVRKRKPGVVDALLRKEGPKKKRRKLNNNTISKNKEEEEEDVVMDDDYDESSGTSMEDEDDDDDEEEEEEKKQKKKKKKKKKKSPIKIKKKKKEVSTSEDDEDDEDDEEEEEVKKKKKKKKKVKRIKKCQMKMNQKKKKKKKKKQNLQIHQKKKKKKKKKLKKNQKEEKEKTKNKK